MTQISVRLDELKHSPSNVRPKHTKEDIAMMANSIKHRGIINPPSIAKNGDGRYEIIAGNLRTEGARAAGLVVIICDDVTHLNDAERVELSLSENVDRRRMTVVQEYIAFDKLFRAGRSVAEIASRFNKTEKLTQQILAIGSLPKKLLDDDVGERTIRCLAVAPTADVRRYMKLASKDRPKDWEIQKWLAGSEGMYLAKNALFDTDEITTKYKGASFVDLFSKDDELWFLDGAQFLELQAEAVKAKIAEFIAKGWKVERLEQWQSWAYDKTSKKNGGEVYWLQDERSAAVEFHVGYKRMKKAGAEVTKKKEKKEAKPETSQAFNDYMAEVRHDAVCRHMVDDKTAGLIATIVVLLKQIDNVSLQNRGTRVKAEAAIKSLNESENAAIVRDDFKDMTDELGITDKQMYNIKVGALVKKLQAYVPETLQRFIITIIARNWTLTGNGKESDELGKALGIIEVKVWEADDAFWNGINNQATLIKIAKQCKIPIDEKATTKITRAILKAKVPATWRPDWLKF